MEKNVVFAYVTRDGVEHTINVAGVCNVLDAAFELASSILNGDLKVDPNEIVAIKDLPG